MALVSKAIMLDITPGAIPKVVNVSEYDENRQYTVTLVDEGGVFEIPSGTTAKVEGSIGGNAFSETATVSGNAITFTLTESMTAWAGNAWCKIKLTKDSKPIQTAAFILRCDKAGVEAKTIINAPGFQEQINEGIAEYFDNDPPFFELPEGGQRGQALLSDGANGAVWGTIKSGSGLTDAIKTALLACFANVAWIDQNGQTYYDALSDALYAEEEEEEDEGGGGGETSEYTDPAAWNLNKTIVSPFQGKGYLEAMSDLDARMVTKATTALDSGSYYRISCASPYELYMIFCDATDVCQAALPNQGRTTNQAFLVRGNNKMGVVVATPSTASIADPRNAVVTLAKEKKQTGLEWSLNVAVYTNRTNEPFDEIQASVDARMLLTSFIPLESGKTYQVRCNSPYEMYLLMLDENNIYKKMEGATSYGQNMITFTNSGGYAKMSIAIKTPATATRADVSAIQIYVV